ncbi:MAG: hypothetical protein KKE44_11110 [Proteobacteria bacterium]|nr:hypothetical protein [Pseudomonadota bacterium]MBU1583271.1 hypothetical protein [Pseudomonadota bacterium]MBU2452595.1 hypothetical protein [Pseudomonadota bacterium]MBU2632074.1 hypothetical protein [Pseudomonadota bacterium]
MSDFLRNLRSSHKKDKSDPRRNLDGHYYPQKDRRDTQDRRSNHSENLESLWVSLVDMLPQMVDTASTINLLLEKLLAQNELLLEAKLRQHNSITFFFDNLNKIFSEDFLVKPSGKKTKATASYASGTHYTKDEILTIIRTMRKEDATFAIIADYLKDKGIPTFSGRGEWHAQTIHRLCK